MGLYNLVLNYLADNEKLLRLLSLAVHSSKVDDIPFPTHKVLDFEDLKPGDRIKITWMSPYRIDYGFVFTLPGLIDEFLVQIPMNEDDESTQSWYVLKHLALAAALIERDI
jgi:hypothetical protein